MQEKLIQAATQEPVSLSMAKQYLRVTHSLEDAVIAGMVSSARKLVEDTCRISISPQRWIATYRLPKFKSDAFGLLPRIEDPERIRERCALPRSPVTTINSVGVQGRNGKSFGFTTFELDTNTSSLAWTNCNGIMFRWGFNDLQYVGGEYDTNFTQVGIVDCDEYRHLSYLTVDYWAGFPLFATVSPGTKQTPFQADVIAPPDLVQAILIVLSSLYENRGDDDTTIPKKALLAMRPYFNSTRSAG